ncbi:MAG: hypothetical protein ACYC63_19615 [Armatimonadota bacterium]
MQIALAIIVTLIGIALLFLLFRGLKALQDKLGKMSEETPVRVEREPGGPVTTDQLLYLYSQDFVKTAPKRPLGSIPRDRAYTCVGDTELDCDDFAKQLLYAVLTELVGEQALQTRIVPRDPSYMPPYPHKRWELQFRPTKLLPASPLGAAFNAGFEIARKNRQRIKRGHEELTHDEEFFSLEEVLERALKALRQEMSFWERGTVCSDLRHYVEMSLIEEGYLIAPEKNTWLDTVRPKRPTCNEQAIAVHEHEAQALLRRLETFKKMHGSGFALNPVQNEKGEVIDIDPKVLNAGDDLTGMPIDDVLRATIHEAIVSIKQLEPSGEAGI